MPHVALIIFTLIALTALGGVSARRLGVPPSIFLVVLGLAAGFLPGMPKIPIAPEVVLQVLLPPLLYTAGVGMSWRGFKQEGLAILLLAVGCVFATAIVVALVTHAFLGWSIALGFVLGAIVSPPDAVAPIAIAKKLPLPQRILDILEGEGLVNDATALIIFSFAVAAVERGNFSLPHAFAEFLFVVAAGIAWGIFVGWGALRLRHVINEPHIEILLALLTPYVAFWPLQAVGASGVIAAVASGLYVSANGARYISPATRLQGFFFWDLVVYITEGAIFVITGLQARPILDSLSSQSWQRLALAVVLVNILIIVVRLIWVLWITRLPLASMRRLQGLPCPPWQHDFFIGFTGIRGVVSLAAALSIPLLMGEQHFPERGLILIITFSVILVTLIGQGSILPWVVRVLRLPEQGRREEALAKQREINARVAGIEAALDKVTELETKGISQETMRNLQNRQRDRREYFVRALEGVKNGNAPTDYLDAALDVIDAERKRIAALYAEDALTDEARRRIERELDLEDARARHAYSSALPIQAEELLEP